jgi:hypothetical protein
MLGRLAYLAVALAATPAADSHAESGTDRETRAKVRRLKAERRDALKKALALRIAQYREGFNGRGTTGAELARVSRMLLKAELEEAAKPAERLTAYALHLAVAKLVERIARAGVKADAGERADAELARADRLQAEADWLKAGGRDLAVEVVGKGIRTGEADKELLRAVAGLATHLDRALKEKGGKDRDD